MPVIVESTTGRPSSHLHRWMGGYSGNRLDGFPPGAHRALPSAAVVVVLSMGEPIEIAYAGTGSGSITALVAGLRTDAGLITHQGSAYDVSIEMTPAGSEAVLGVPASDLTGSLVDLGDLWGRKAVELVERLASADSWGDRFAVLDETLARRIDDAGQSLDPIELAWYGLLKSGGLMSVSDLAREVGYSRRHLHHRFTSEYGVTPKEASRLVRFQNSVGLLRDSERRRQRGWVDHRSGSLGEVAVRAGFYDQAHMTREWNDLAGCSPSAWLAEEELPFVQDIPEARVHDR